MPDLSVYRIIDANLNRLREALRVIEEFVRFVEPNESLAVRCKGLRHSLENIEQGLGTQNLLAGRATETDPFAGETRPEERTREGIAGVLSANFKRAQEAARVIEEYAKLSEHPEHSDAAKLLRFSLYNLEKDILVSVTSKKSG